MSDERFQYEGGSTAGAAATPQGAPPASEWQGYCQSCGKPVTAATAKMYGSAVFCEPCLQAQPRPVTPLPAGAGLPNPVLAACLAFIPGVGAMYNGQYAKGVAHVVVFIVLYSLSDHVSGAFGLLVAGWIFYQVFDAFHTARARLLGAPLPNPFGLNDIGERMGFGKNWGVVNHVPVAPPVPPTAPGGADWVGYVPPANFGGATVPPGPAAAPASAWGQVPYSQTYAPPPAAAVPYPVEVPPVAAAVPVGRRFPVGAAWLVGLGLLFLLGEFAPEWGWDWSLTHRWALTVLFAGLGLWAVTRRWTTGRLSLRSLRPAIFFFTLAILFGLQAADVVSLARTWPVMLIVAGAVLLAERSTLGSGGVVDSATGFVPIPNDAEAEAARARAAWPQPPAGDTTGETKGGL